MKLDSIVKRGVHTDSRNLSPHLHWSKSLALLCQQLFNKCRFLDKGPDYFLFKKSALLWNKGAQSGEGSVGKSTLKPDENPSEVQQFNVHFSSILHPIVPR